MQDHAVQHAREDTAERGGVVVFGDLSDGLEVRNLFCVMRPKPVEEIWRRFQ